MLRKLLLPAFLLVAADASGAEIYDDPGAARYSQKVLLKNWAFSACLSIVATDDAARADANATAGAYLEYGHQPIEAYEELRQLAEQFARRQYAGSVPSHFNTMKCIDLFHSRALDRLTAKWLRKG
ncbi:MAG: T6SS amidase immunity protein Tai4 family protein [Bacteroidales bacterium]